MIATVKVLGLSARGAAAVDAAARRIVAYVEGGLASESAARATDYYTAGVKAPGRARGSAAALVGLRGTVTAEQLQRLLTGAHAVTGQPLLDGIGSAGRLDRGRRIIPPEQESFTLSEAARIAGVDVSYLRRLARRTAAADIPPPPRAGRPRDADGPAQLRAERDPRSGQWRLARAELLRFLARRQPPTVVIGYDVVCSAPKSVSIADAFGDDDLRADLTAALDAGVDALVAYLERYAVQGMVDGRNRPGLGLAAASYRHEVSRADEAHLHIHNIIANAVALPLLDDDGHPDRDPDGVARVAWRALDGEVFLQHVRTAGFVGAAAMRHELTRRRGVTWGPVRNGVAELAAFPAPLLAAFSTRHGQVHEEFAALVADGLFPDGRTQAAAQRRSRASKKVRADAEIRAIQTRRLTDAGWTPAQVRALLHRRDRPSQPPAPPTPQDIITLVDRLVGPQGLTATSPVFTRREVYQEVAAWAVDRLDSPSLTGVVDAVLADPRIVLVHEQSARRRRRAEQSFTTEDLLDVEDSLLTLYRQGRVELGGAPRTLLPADAVDGALSAALPHAGEAGAIQLSDEQRGALRALLTSADLMRPVVGPAGSGKTTVMRALARILTARGYTVLGATHGGRQAEQLATAVDIPTRVVSGWNTLLDTADEPTDHWPAGRTVLIVDEATQISTRDAERLARHATRTATVMILVGDPAQLGSVGAGGWFPHLVGQNPPIALTAVHRQQGPAMRNVRAALAGLRSAMPSETMAALARLARDGNVQLFDDRDALLAAAVTDWYSERATTGTAAAMMAEHQRDVDALTVTARATLLADGTLTGPVLTVAGREFQAGDEVITLTQAGHTLVPEGRSKGRYIRTGTVGHVTAVHVDPARPHAQTVTVHFPGKGSVRIGWDYLTYAFPDGRTGGLAHAYALTAHKAQGSTMPTARPLLADDTSRAGLYVMLSRAQRDLRGYLIRRADLDANLDDEDWLPILPTADAVDRLAEHLRTSRTDRLAADLDPHARAAHHLAADHTLPALADLRSHPPRQPAAPSPVLVRRAELAAEAALITRTLANPHPALLARIGPRPPSGPHRTQWDQAVAALAIYRAHWPDTPADDAGPAPPPAASDTPTASWTRHRHHASALADTWAATLAPRARRRFAGQTDAVPRQRAIAGIHALLDAGWQPVDLTAHLTAQEQDTIRSPAAVLDHRVAALCQQHGINPDLYRLPPPRTAGDLWHDATTKLDAAAIAHLATQPTSRLAAHLALLHRVLTADSTDHDLHDVLTEHHQRAQLTYRLTDDHPRPATATEPASETGPEPAPLSSPHIERPHRRQVHHATAQRELHLSAAFLAAFDGDHAALATVRAHEQHLDAALTQQIDHAVLQFDQEPARYLTDLLGPKPTAPGPARTWLARARQVEDYRHRTLGLPYGQPAQPHAERPAHRALGTPPTDPDQRRLYQQLTTDPATLDLPL